MGERMPHDWQNWFTSRPLLRWPTAIATGGSLLFLGAALGGGGPSHVIPLGTFVVGLLAAGGALGQLHVARRRHEEQTRADFQRRITESYTKAVEQISSDKLVARLGGIFALERISRESPDDYWTVMETLTGFVRERARWKEPVVARVGGDPNRGVPGELGKATDIEAALTVLRRRNSEGLIRERRSGWRLDLRDVDLTGADLSEVHLEEANLRGAHLDETILNNACLEGANLFGATLKEAHLFEANLKGANLVAANLQAALLFHTNLEGADLLGAELQGADLATARGLTKEQLESAKGDEKTLLPRSFAPPPSWA